MSAEKKISDSEFFSKICNLREMQKRYFKGRRIEVLNACKELEKDFDSIINSNTIESYRDSKIFTLINLSAIMRYKQTQYFATKNDTYKHDAKDYERRVDVAIISIKHINEPEQLKLF